MKRTRIKTISAKKRRAMREEVTVRQAVCLRAGGCWIDDNLSLYGGVCVGGTCEECGKPPRGRMRLEFAHEIARSHGGETTKENTWMKCIECHKGGDHHESIILDSKPQWSRKEG